MSSMDDDIVNAMQLVGQHYYQHVKRHVANRNTPVCDNKVEVNQGGQNVWYRHGYRILKRSVLRR